jgi:enoyl-CoA hydratase/carnithine racemase
LLTPRLALIKSVVVGLRGQAVGGGVGLMLTGVFIVVENTKFVSAIEDRRFEFVGAAAVLPIKPEESIIQ